MIDATPVDVATAIYKQMKGYILVSTFLRFTVYFSLEIADKIHTNQFMHTLLYISVQYSTGHDLFLNLQKLLTVMVMGTSTTRCLQCLHSFLKNKGKLLGTR